MKKKFDTLAGPELNIDVDPFEIIQEATEDVTSFRLLIWNPWRIVHAI